MQTLFAPLFKQFALIEHPIRYFILMFFYILGGLHFAFDLWHSYQGEIVTDSIRTIWYAFFFTVAVFGARYIEQKKQKKVMEQVI